MRIKNDFSVWPRTIKASGRVVFYYQTYDENGKRTVPRSTGKATKTEAVRYCNGLMREGSLVPLPKMNTFGDYAKGWWDLKTCEYCQMKQARQPLTETHIKTFRQNMNNHVLPRFKDVRLVDITSYEIEKWLFDLLNQGYKKSSINGLFSTLRVMLGEAVRRGILRANPATRVKALQPDVKKRKLLSLEELSALFPPDIDRVWRNRMAAMANMLAAYTGMRLGEVAGLKGSLVFPDYISVAMQYNSARKYTETKTKTERDIPITPVIYQQLQSLIALNGDGYVFSIDGGKTPFPREGMTRGLIEALGNIGIDEKERKERGLTFHSWRHFFITCMRMGNVSDKKARDVAGHASMKMNDHYTHLNTREFDDVRDVQNNLAIIKPETMSNNIVFDVTPQEASPVFRKRGRPRKY
jgi:integrase